ncbi:ABC transporter substrate-binding protein [Pseudarthrobacter sp. N5]|uniref:ABC transporter substrate-binding protein n=1 Tax=Pseudarthrobacter sp. N5 TaxID=3418416 RepID=UPI003CEDEA53
MSHPIDVGSVLGGRYKVTGNVLTSHDQDLVLDGVDQVLNRKVSILVAGPDNAEQVAQSAREVATGERPGTVQILDLGVSEATTYLITNHTSAADLLDLVVASHPPYVEPFFTDTLGSEIFGQARSHEPEPYDAEDEVNAGYINYSDGHGSQADPGPAASQPSQPSGAPKPAPSLPPRTPARPAVEPSAGVQSMPTSHGAAAAGLAGGAAGAAASAAAAGTSPTPATAPQAATPPAAPARPSAESTAPQTVQSAGQAQPAAAPKVSLWSDDDYDDADTGQQDQYSSTGSSGGPVEDRPAGNFPAFARSSAPPATADYDDDDQPEKEPRSMRWLVGGLLALVLVAALVFAVSNLGSFFKSQPEAKPAPGTSNSSQPTTGQPSATQGSEPAAGPPTIAGITRLGNFDFAATYDADLSKTFDGNAASFWSDMEFASDNWGGLAGDGVSLVVKLKGASKVSSVTLSQLGATGGSISVFTNDRPSLDGAKQIGTNSFTSTDLTMPLAEPATAQYVIVSIEKLPKLAAPKTRFGFGLRLAEIKIQ